VDDAATQKLMTRFYENLWHKRLPRLEALRQAQLSILYDLPTSSVPRGALVVRERRADTSAVRAGPRLWAAWVLSGDPGDLAQTTPAAAPALAPAAAPPVAETGVPFRYVVPLAVAGLLLMAGALVIWKRRRSPGEPGT